MTDGRVTVTLGDGEYPVVPQRVGYVLNQLGPDLGLVLEVASEGNDESTGRVVGKQAHGVLRTLIPSYTQPLWEFLGFGSEEAYSKNEYLRELDKSPNLPEISHAIKMAAKVNVGEGLDFLREVVGPELLQRFIALAVASMAETGTSDNSSGEPASSPQPNGASAPTSSGTTAPTPTASEGSPSPDSGV